MTYPRNQAIYFVVFPGLILLSAAGVCAALRIAAASHDSLAPNLIERSAAASHFPWSAEYQVRLADLRRASGLSSTSNFADAVAGSPRDGRLWIQFGLAQEQDGDLKGAEASLLRAGTLGRDYDTLWTLTNFYFRRADRDLAVAWACAVLSIAGVEGGPVFSLLANFPAKPDCILRSDFGGPQNVLRDYLLWLISKNNLDAAGEVADILIRKRDPEAMPLLLSDCDRLLLAGKTQAAARLWDSLAEQGWVSAPVLAKGGLMDGDLKLVDPPHGFAWRMPPVTGVEPMLLHPGLQISLSGSQPDRCELLSQWVRIGSAPAQTLHYRSVASGLAAGSGVHWRVTTPAGVDLPDGAPFKPNADIYDRSPPEALLGFKRAPGGDRIQATLIHLALVYERAPGAVPARGWVRLEKVWLSE